MTIKKFNVDSLDQTANVRIILNSDLGNITLGNVYVANLFDLSGNTFSPGGGGVSSAFVFGNTAPQSPSQGDRWLDSDTLIETIFVQDGDSGQWVQPYTEIPVGATGPQGIPGEFAGIGATGATGPVGPIGPTGSTGSIGASGFVSGIEFITPLTLSTGTVIHNYTTGTVWHHSSILANFTVNFTNVPTTNNQAITFVLFLYQGATPYSISAVQIDGSTQGINWFDSVTPTSTANKKEIWSFNLVRVGNTWTVHGNMSSYG